MDYGRGFGTVLSISQIYETTISDSESGLSAHFIIVPARSLGGGSYLFRISGGIFQALGLLRLADVPLGGVTRSFAACLVSEDVEEFLRRFNEGFEEEIRHSGVTLPEHFAFAEYLTFANVIPFEWSTFSIDSLGNVLTAQGHGEAGYMNYEETQTTMLIIAIPEGILMCGSASKMIEALEAGLRHRILELVKSRPGEERREGEGN